MQRFLKKILYCVPVLISFPLLSEITKENCKESIAILQEQLKKTTGENQSDIKKQLATAYLLDQETEKAFSFYLEALDSLPSKPNTELQANEQKLYEEALKVYLAHNSGLNPQEAAQKILQDYGPSVEQNPNYVYLNFLIAASYANLGRFDEFFSHFYSSYKAQPNSYMAYRTKAILHIKLYEKARTALEKEQQRQKIEENLNLALKQYPVDSSLYKLQITFAKDQDKPAIVGAALKKIVSENIIVPRPDILFYVSQGVEAKQKELARQFLNKAKEWYQYSRVINAAEEVLNK